MSGIYGLVRTGPALDLQAGMRAMLETGLHRGPHGRGERHFESAAIGHLWLDVQPSGVDAAQPIADLQGELVIALDGELHNTGALRRRLESRGDLPARCVSFPELFLAAYRSEGEACLQHIEGVFAVAIWDLRRKRLFLARDRIGIKPLFHARWQGGLAFASEITQLLALPGFERKANEGMVSDYLFTDVNLERDSFFEGIHRLTPGHFATVDAETAAPRVETWWRVDPDYRVDLPDDAAYAERFREILTESIRRNISSAGPLGAALSGGLDSSSIVCIADRLRRDAAQTQAMETFSLSFDDKMADETQHVHAVGAATNINHNHYRADGENVFEHMATVQRRQAEPMRSLGIVLFWRLKQLASQKGMRVLLSGMGADEVLGGINLYYLADLLREGRLVELRRSLDALVQVDPYALGYSRRKYLHVFGLRPLVPQRLRLAWRDARGGGVPDLATAAFAERVDLRHRMIARYPRELTDVYRQSSFDAMQRNYTALLLHYEDANNAGFGIESRFPFLDHHLVEFLFGLPREQKVRGARAKIVLRHGMTGILPDSVRTRVDKGFIDRPVDQWLAHQYTDSVQARMFGKRLADTGWVDQKRLREHYEQYRQTHAGRVVVWKCFNLGLWLEEFF